MSRHAAYVAVAFVAERRYLSEESMAKIGEPVVTVDDEPSPSPPDTLTDAVDDHEGADRYHSAGDDPLTHDWLAAEKFRRRCRDSEFCSVPV